MVTDGLCIVLCLGDVYDIIHMYFYQRGVNMIIVGLLYIIVLVLVVLWFVAWISMPFKLDRVNQNLAEIKELLREQKGGKTVRKKTVGK